MLPIIKSALTNFAKHFVGYTRHEDLSDHFVSALDFFVQSNLLQVSMDGPNVNWAFFPQLRNYRAENNMTKVLTTGSQVIHSIHGAFKIGENKADWNVKKLLKALHQILSDTPARRANYTDVTGSQNFPRPLVVLDGLRIKRWQLKRLIFGKTCVSYGTSISHSQKASKHLVKAL